jgi:hypothetical protein
VSQTEITIIVVAAIALAVGLRIWRTIREQRMKVALLWVAPALVAVLVAWILVFDGLTSVADVALALVVLALGAGMGLYQGSHTTVRADRSAALIYVKTKPIGAAIVVIVIAARLLLRTSYVLPALQNGAIASGTVPLPPKGDTLSLISAMLLVFALGMISGLRIFLYRRYRASGAPAAG